MGRMCYLEPAREPGPGDSALAISEIMPVLAGDAADAGDQVCGACRKQVMTTGLLPDHVLGLLLRCPRCGTYSRSMVPPPGSPISPCAVFIPPGEFWLGQTFNQPATIVMAALWVSERYRRETGADGLEGRIAATNGTLDALRIDADMLSELVERARSILGANFDKVMASEARSRASATPSADCHRLAYLVHEVQDILSGRSHLRQESAGPTVELLGSLALIERWRFNPLYASLMREMGSPGNYLHNLLLLGVAGFLVDRGNGINLRAAREGARTCDLAHTINPATRINMEVKTPQALQSPARALDGESARRILRRARRAAGTGAGSQLGPESEGLLIVGGTHLDHADLDTLARNAAEVFQGRPHLIGAFFVSLGVASRKGIGGRTEMQGTFRPRYTPNPNYAGEAFLIWDDRGT